MGRLAAGSAAPGEKVRAAEVIGALSLATDMGIGVSERAGGAFDPEIATQLADDAAELLAADADGSASADVLACEPAPRVGLGRTRRHRAVGRSTTREDPR